MADPRQRIVNVVLDDHTVVRRHADVEHERAVAIYDLLEENHFAPTAGAAGPYVLHLAIEEGRVVFDIRDEAGRGIDKVGLALGSLRRVIKDYFIVCENYYAAIRSLSPSRIEAIDVGRRGLHDEGSEILRARLAGKIEVDFTTARRLFTLLCVLHVKG